MKSYFMLSVLVIFNLFYIEVFPQSDTVFNHTDAANLKQGWWKKSYPNGKIMYKGFFKDNKPVGEMRRYYENGSLKAVLQYDGQGVYARARLLYADGHKAAEGWYYQSRKDSTWTYFSYYDHSLATKETFTRGVRNGLMVNYYNNGNISEILGWKDDKKDGPWEQYFGNKNLKLKGGYKNGQLDGEFLVYYESGKPYLKGNYVKDLREGNWTFFKEDGSKDKELVFHQGVAADENKLNQEQQELFKMINDNKGKFKEPDETNFLSPAGR